MARLHMMVQQLGPRHGHSALMRRGDFLSWPCGGLTPQAPARLSTGDAPARLDSSHSFSSMARSGAPSLWRRTSSEGARRRACISFAPAVSWELPALHSQPARPASAKQACAVYMVLQAIAIRLCGVTFSFRDRSHMGPPHMFGTQLFWVSSDVPRLLSGTPECLQAHDLVSRLVQALPASPGQRCEAREAQVRAY